MSTALRKMAVIIGANITDFMSGMDKVDKRLLSQSRQMERIGKDLTVGLTLPLAAVGVASLKAATEYQNASAIIRRQTGATGETLVGLNQQFRNLFTTVPATSRDTATALATLQTRTGLAGKELENLTRQHLNLARITGEAVAPMIEQTTRVFGDWSIATEHQGQALDYLYRVSQQTGIGVARLGQLVVQYGAPLRQMGFTFEQAAAMLGKFEKEGVNVELVLGSLRVALGKMAQEGVTDTAGALRLLIEQIKNAGSTGQANAIALEAFGARAGPDMAAAIREGRFDLEGLMNLLGASTDTINGVAEETLTFTERLALLRNKAIDAAQPLGNVLIKSAEAGIGILQGLAGAAGAAGKALDAMPGPLADLTVGLGIGVAAIGPAIVGYSRLANTITNLKIALQGMQTATLVGLAIGAVVAIGTMIARENQRVAESQKQRAAEIQDAMVREATAARNAAMEKIHADELALNVGTATLRQRIANLETEKAAHRKALQDRLDNLGDEKSAAIQAIRDEYGVAQTVSNSKTDLARRTSQAVIDSLEHEARVARETAEVQIELYNVQYRAKLKLLDDETAAAVLAIENQIKAIDEQTKQEDKALRRAQMEKRIAEEEDADRRAELIAELKRWELLEEREAQKSVLQIQIENIRTDAKNKREALEAELKEKEQAERDKLQFELDRIEDAKKAENDALAETIERIQQERIAKEKAEEAKFKALKTSLENQIEGLDAYYADLKIKLDRDLANFIANEDQKNAELRTDLEERRKEVEEFYAWLNDPEEIEKRALEQAKAEYEARRKARAALGEYLTEQGTLEGDIAPDPGRTIPPFATGAVVNAGPRGMIARIGEVPEAVTPLDWLSDQMRRVATEIASAFAQQSPVSPAPAAAGAPREITLNVYQTISDRATADYTSNSLARLLRNYNVGGD